MQLWKTLYQRARRVMYRDGATPLPFSILLVVFTVAFSSSWIYTTTYSYLPKLVKWFGFNSVDTGVNVGIIDTSMYIGAFISSALWGYLSDKKGKRWGVLATNACCVVSTLAFGFSRGLWWALVTRFLQGCSVGQVVVLKGLLKEVCDDTNISVAMSVLLTAPAVGSMIGPSLGGFTAFPHQMYPKLFTKEGLFGKFPALLPNGIIAVGIGVTIFLTKFISPRDGHKTNAGDCERSPLLQGDAALHGDDFNINYNSTETRKQIESIAYNDRENMIKRSFASKLCDTLQNSNIVTVLRTKECLLCCILFMLFAASDTGFGEMLPIVASTDPKYSGLGLQPADVGLLLTVVSIVQALFQLTLLPKLSTHFGPQKFLIISSIVQALFCPLVPALSLLSNRILMWVGLVLVTFVVNTCIFTGYLSLDILINNSVDVNVIGSAIGVTMTTSYLGRLVAPIMFGGIYSWSLGNIKGVPGNVGALGFPFNQFLTFFVMSMLSIICAALTKTLPYHVNFVAG